MSRYRKLPVEIEAIQWDGLNLQEIINFVGNNLKYEIIDTAWQVGKGKPYVDMEIVTLEGNMKVSEKDYIIKGVNGEFYPCKPEIFEKTYEKLENYQMSKADEIFDKLGYEKKHDNKRRITYKNRLGKIEFYQKNKWIYISFNLDMQELQAINEKVKELGWNA